MSEPPTGVTYRVTVRYRTRLEGYEVFEVEAASVVEALARAAEKIPEAIRDSADLVEVRRAHPAG